MSFIRAARPLSNALRSSNVVVSQGARYAPRVLATQSVLSKRNLNKASKVERSKWASNPTIDYRELRPITEQPSDNILLIDVREREENALGSIPSSVNLPLSEFKEAMDEHMNPGEFQRKYAFSKPLRDQKIIVYCRSGKRSATAAEVAEEKGYHNVRNYTGSWLDWSKRTQSSSSGDDDD